ncbi:ATP-NAD kinase family protein [Clostridiisalibacter paucivorans]|uniref:ATP-NAD kinase family protein n=1 Tax=Clostridiisalibacter paucivorans TaxID=408753 RepID=UPI00047A032C|nr:NAD(+)/NADH kinase [Clostridiisalibacter paucivorans]
MITIGIIANPSSGKDIRRLVSHATVVDNNEKVNIVERIILGAQGCGVEKVYIMPDTFQIGYRVIDKLSISKELNTNIEVLDMNINGETKDSVIAAKDMEDKKVGALVVLGGDGTNRAVAKSVKHVPIISLSTGTNNVYPEMIEGTVAGMAAAVVASGKYLLEDISRKDKQIEIYKNGAFTDIALVDAVISKKFVIGSRAIWDMEDIVKVIVSRAHPASIGFSSLVGCNVIVKENDDFGACIDLTEDKYKVIAPIAAGILKEVKLGSAQRIKLNEKYIIKPKYNGMIALDGEREIPFKADDALVVKITRNGPYHVDIKKTLEIAQRDGFFNK